MNRKGALELSVNAIVILIIALAVMGMVIGFAVSQFRDLSGQVEFDELPGRATGSKPFGLPGAKEILVLSGGDRARLSMNILNTDSAETLTGVEIVCRDFLLTTEATALGPNPNGVEEFGESIEAAINLAPNQQDQVNMFITAPGAYDGEHACTIYGTSASASSEIGRTQSIFVKIN